MNVYCEEWSTIAIDCFSYGLPHGFVTSCEWQCPCSSRASSMAWQWPQMLSLSIELKQSKGIWATAGPPSWLESTLFAFIRTHMGTELENSLIPFPWTLGPHGSQVCQFFVWVNPHAWIVYATWRTLICTQTCTECSISFLELYLFPRTGSYQIKVIKNKCTGAKNRIKDWVCPRICIQVVSILSRGISFGIVETWGRCCWPIKYKS